MAKRFFRKAVDAGRPMRGFVHTRTVPKVSAVLRRQKLLRMGQQKLFSALEAAHRRVPERAPLQMKRLIESRFSWLSLRHSSGPKASRAWQTCEREEAADLILAVERLMAKPAAGRK